MFAKIFVQIFDGSLGDNPDLRHFFMDLLLLCNIDGFVEMTDTAISARTRLPLDRVRFWLSELEKPDPLSRSADENGRRIILMFPERGWGWKIVNYLKYRDIRDDETRREYQRKWDREHAHERHKNWKYRKAPTSPDTDPTNPTKAEAEAEAEAEASTPSPVPSPAKNGGGEGFKEADREKFAGLLSAIYGRSTPYTAWTQAAQFNFSQLLSRPALEQEILALTKFKPRYKYFPQSLGRLMEKWDDVLDASRNGDIEKKPKNTFDKNMSRTVAQIAAIEKRGY
jgi:hypothetical protein